MNHQKVHDLIIERARSRGLKKSKVKGYHEIHHVNPKCLGGTNHSSNLVLLTGREHFIVHALLCYIHPKNYKILLSWHIMHYSPKHLGREIKSKKYESLKRDYVEAVGIKMKGKTVSQEQRDRQSKTMKGRKSYVRTPEKFKCGFGYLSLKYIKRNFNIEDIISEAQRSL